MRGIGHGRHPSIGLAEAGADVVVAYNASKVAVVSLTQDIAVKLAADNLRINRIAPGAFLTDMMRHLSEDESALNAFERSTPQNRSGKEDDIKGAWCFWRGRPVLS